MKLTINVECSPEEARAFLGLPDVSSINEMMVEETRKRLESNLDAMDPEAVMKNWMAFGGMMTEQFANLMGAAATGAAKDESKK
jgi:hypothetical protein